MKYSRSNIIDFLDNDDTEITWDKFIDMIHDKFGDECEIILHHMANKFGRVVLSKESTEKLTKVVDSMNEVF